MDVKNSNLIHNTIEATLIDKAEDPCGYLIYIFRIDSKRDVELYGTNKVMCVRFPNWNHYFLEIGDSGFLTFKPVKAGIDKWYDGEKLIAYNYDNMIFLSFLKHNNSENTNIIDCITF